MNILIVDDNPTDLKLLDAGLGTSGHLTRPAATAEAALVAALRQLPDASLLDLQLPGMARYGPVWMV
jgi:CheY-like chemotaxis protein